MRILGIDPGSRITGFGVIEPATGSTHRCRAIVSGTFRLGDGPLPGRLLQLYRSLAALIAEHRPTAVAVEGIFAKVAPRSALTLGQARGIALLCAAEAELPVHEYPPATVKRSVAQSGASSKGGVARSVAMLLGLHEPVAVDASDALAVALCHLSRSRLQHAPSGAPSAWVRALAAAPPVRQSAANALLAAAVKGRSS